MYDYTAYIEKQLKQREIKMTFYQFRYLSLEPSKVYYEMKCYNQLLFLLSPSALPVGTRLVSESRIKIIEANSAQLEGIEDFSGLLTIELPDLPLDKKTIEFIEISL